MATLLETQSVRSKLLYTSALSFGKGPEQPPPPTRVSDNLRSEDQVEILLGLGEGPWSKLHDGLKSFYIANTPLMASDGTLNFPDAQLIFHKGTAMPDPIKYSLGGSASGHSVGVNLAQNAAVTRTTTSGDIDAIDVRLRIDQLMKNTEDGDQLNEDLLFRVEVKPTSSGTWTSLPPNTGWLQSWTEPEVDDNRSGIFGNILQRIEELKAEESLTQYQAELQAWQEYQDNADGPIDTSLGVTAYAENIRIYGRTQSPVMKEIRIPVVRLTNDTYDVRVTKISAESTSTSVREITWDTFEQITIEDKTYPNTAMAQLLVKASDQLSNVPQMYGIYDTAEILVPSIFDPVTRSYDFSGGPWDGTFKVAFTDDLAWIIYDLVHNDVHGIAAYHSINFSKYEALEASIYWNACDPVTGAYVGVPRPAGGTRPRATFNGLIDQPRNSMELLTYMAGAGNAVFYEDVEGNFRLKVEQDTAPTQTFNNMDVENGRFQYSFSDVNTRYNDITVVYRNKKLPAYQEDRRRVFDQSNIDAYGSKPLTFVAVGCVDTDEAITRAYHKLITSLTETRNVAFTTTRMGAYVEPHDIILIADEAMDEGHSRRCMLQDGLWITPNEPLTLEAGINDYIMRIQTTDGVLEVPVNVQATLAGYAEGRIRVTGALPATLPDNFSFSISSASLNDVRPYRVTSIEEGDGERIKISAIEVNRSKYSLVDNFDGQIFDVDVVEEPTPPSSQVQGLQALVTERATSNGKVNDIELTWDAPSTSYAGAVYVVRYSFNDLPSTEVARSTNRLYRLTDAPLGTHVFSVSTLNADGSESPSVQRVRVTTLAPNYGLPSITGVTIQNRKGSDSQYIGRNVSFEWSVDKTEKWKDWELDKPHPDFDRYEIDVVDNTSGSIVHTYSKPSWTDRKHEITYEELTSFGLTSIRDYSVVVSISDASGNEGASFARSIEKPATNITNFTVLAPSQIYSNRGKISYDVPVDPDFRGLEIHAGDAVSGNPRVWKGEGFPIIDLYEGTTYISYTPVDVFGTVGQPTTNVTFTAPIADLQEVLDDLDTDIADVLDEVEANTLDIADLTTTYGSTASAAQSAVEAAAARDAAQQHETNSQTAQNLAETARTAAENAAISAEDAVGVAVSTAISGLPETMEDADTYFTDGFNTSLTDVSTNTFHTLFDDPVEGPAIRTQGGHAYIAPKGFVTPEVGRTYEVFATVRYTTLPTNGAGFRYGVREMNADQIHSSANHQEEIPTTSDVITYKRQITFLQADYDAGIRTWRPELLANFSNGDGVMDTFRLGIRDISEVVAASLSEYNAGVSETEAGQHAAAAASSVTSAQTAQAGAESAETNAAQSETNADGSASAAASSAQNAANSENAAGGHATAAAGSASSAASEATDAGNSASAAASSAVTAGTEATDAENSAIAAASSAQNAAASETAAGTSATAAENSNIAAGTSATNAAASEGAAAQSETNADGSASAAAASEASVDAALVLIAGDGQGTTYTPRPDIIQSNRDEFTGAIAGLTSANPTLSTSIWVDVTDPDMGPSVQSNGKDIIATRYNYPVEAGVVWTYTMKYKAITDSTGPVNKTNAYIRWLDDTGAQLGATYIGTNSFLVADGVQTSTFSADMASAPAGATMFKVYSYNNITTGSNGVANFYSIKLEKPSSGGTDTGYVGAAAASAAAAAVSETNAGTFATASETSSTAAQSAASNAGTSETNAAISATNASGSETNAAASATSAVTAEGNAQNSASAAAASATNAGVSETAAGNFATAAETSSLAAGTAATNAGVSETNAAVSATNAGLAEAAATAQTVVIARAGTESNCKNPLFLNWPQGQTRPTGLSAWNSGGTTERGTTITKFGDAIKITATGGEYGFYGNSTSLFSGDYFVHPQTNPTRYMVLEAWVYLEAGSWDGAGIYMSMKNSGGTSLGGPVFAFKDQGGDLGKWIHMRKFVDITQAVADNAVSYTLYGMCNWSTAGTLTNKTIHWASLSFKPATQQEIEAGKVVDLEASVTTNASAIATNTSTGATLQTDVSTLNATVSSNSAAISDAESDIAILTSSVSTANAAVNSNASAITSLEGYAASQYSINVNANGEMAGLSIRNSSNGNVSISDIKLSADKLIFAADGQPIWSSDASGMLMYKATRWVDTNNTTMYVLGNGFGVNGDLMEWFGAYAATVDSCSKLNGVRAKTTDGKTYLEGVQEGGSAINASDSTTSTVAEVTSIGANGNTAQVTKGYSRNANNSYMSNSNVANGSYTQGSATVKLYRKIGAGNYVEVHTSTVSGTKTVTNEGFDPELGQYIISEQFYMSNSHLYTYNTNAAETYGWKTVLTNESGVPNWANSARTVSVSVFEPA